MELLAGRMPKAWTPLETTTTDEATSSRRSIRSARAGAPEPVRLRLHLGGLQARDLRSSATYTLPVLWGDRLVARFDARMDRSTATFVIIGLWLEDEALAKDEAFAEAMQRGMARLRRFLEAGAIDAQAVTPRSLRSAGPG